MTKNGKKATPPKKWLAKDVATKGGKKSPKKLRVEVETRTLEEVVELLKEFGQGVDFVVLRIHGSPSASISLSPTKAGND